MVRREDGLVGLGVIIVVGFLLDYYFLLCCVVGPARG
jgi:hypothetical protein